MNSTLTVPLPRRAVYVPGGLPRGVRAYYYNAYNRAIKAPDFYLKNVDPLLHWPSAVVGMATCGSRGYSGGDGSKSMSLTDAMSEVLSDNYLSDLLSLYRHRFPLHLRFLPLPYPLKL